MGVRTGAAALGLLAVLTVAGCSSAGGGPDAGVVDAPDQVLPVAGTNVNRVVLSPESAHRLGITTQPVRGQAHALVVPVSAVLYTEDGRTWVYTSPVPFNYVRVAVTLGPVDGDRWTLTSGPAPGTPVVTVGGAELLGAEQGVEGE
jgi:hypothetical protein